MANLLWLQGGACSGNTMSFLNAEEPSVCDLVTSFGIRISVCIEFLVNRKWRDLPELAVSVEPDWYRKPWRI